MNVVTSWPPLSALAHSSPWTSRITTFRTWGSRSCAEACRVPNLCWRSSGEQHGYESHILTASSRLTENLPACVSPSLSLCRLTEKSCTFLASALRSSVIRELDLGYNHPCKRGVEMLSALVEEPCCPLQKLRYLGLRPEDDLNFSSCIV